MTFTALQTLTAAQLNDLDINTLTTSGTVTVGAFTLPATDGTVDQVLVTNGSGTVTWQDQSGGGTPGGSDGQIQYNNGGAFGGASGLFYDDVNNRVGIGTTSPGHPLDVLGDMRVQGSDPKIWLTDNDVGADAKIDGSGTVGGLLISADNFNELAGSIIAFNVDGSERVRIDSSGNVGINDTTPSYKLDVNGTGRFTGDLIAGSGFITVNASSSTEGGEIRLDGGTSYSSTYARIDRYGSNLLRFMDGSAVRMSLDITNGNLDVTGTMSASRLQVGGHYIDDVAGSGDPYGSINVGGAMSWDGYAIDQQVVFMSNGSNFGIYNDVNNQWQIYCAFNGGTDLRHAGTVRIATDPTYGLTSYGAGGYVQIGPANTSWCHFNTDRAKYYFNKGITVDTGYISSYNEDLELHRAGTKRLDITSTENYFSGTRTVHSSSTNSSGYTASQLQSYSGYGSGGVASWTGHIGGQLAPVFRVWTGTGEGFDCNNSIGSAYRYVGGSSFVTRSSERIKRNIKDQADDEIIPTIMDLLSCRTIKFDDISIEPYWCEHDSCFKEPELCEDYDTCGCERCAEIMNAPLQKRHFGRRGYLVEELAEVYPTAVHFESDGKPSGIDYSAVTVELIDAVKLLVLQGDEINRRLTAMETS